MSIPQRIRYGASELRGFYNRNLLLALIVSIAFHLAMIGLYLVSTDTVVASSDWTPVRPLDTLIRIDSPTRPEVVQPKQKGGKSDAPAPRVQPPTPTDRPSTPGDGPVAGNLKSTPDSLLKPDEGKFASVDNLAFASPNGSGDSGTSNGSDHAGPDLAPNGGGGGGASDLAPADEIPSDYIDPDVILPSVDLADLASRTEYPAIARRNGIQGRVTVKVLIDTDGRAMRTAIANGAGSVLDSAAIKAVRETVFQPATLDGNPVRVWLHVPVDFSLD